MTLKVLYNKVLLTVYYKELYKKNLFISRTFFRTEKAIKNCAEVVSNHHNVCINKKLFK